MAIMSVAAQSPPPGTPREVPYSALSEPGPAHLFEDMFDYTGGAGARKSSRSSARKHRKHRTSSSGGRTKILLDNDAVESCDSGISLSDNGRYDVHFFSKDWKYKVHK